MGRFDLFFFLRQISISKISVLIDIALQSVKVFKINSISGYVPSRGPQSRIPTIQSLQITCKLMHTFYKLLKFAVFVG